MSYIAAEARQELLHYVAEAIDEMGDALGAVGAAYELLDEHAGDQLEEQVFRPLQTAYGRAKRTHSGFAQRFGLVDREFVPAGDRAGGTTAQELLAAAVDDIVEADAILSQLQDSLKPVEVGDPELRAGLAEVRTLLGELPARVTGLQRSHGR
jgi:hypothetical protein